LPAARDAAGGVRVSVRQQADRLAAHHRVTVATLGRVLPPIGRYGPKQVLDRAQAAHRAAHPAPEAGMDGQAEPAPGAPATAPAQPATAPAQPATAPARLRVLAYRYLHLPVVWALAEPLQVLAIALWVLLRHGRGVDLVHAHRGYPAGIAVLAARLIGVPAVVTVYGSEIHQQAFGSHPLRRWWIRRVVRRASRVVAVAGSLVRALERLGVPASRRRYVPSGVDLERFTPPADRPALRRALGIEPDARVLLAINLFVPIKGHAILVEAFDALRHRVPGCRLVLTSDGPLRPAIERQVAERGLDDRVRLTGFLDHDDLPRWIAAADLLVLPSLDEGMPLSILEGFACGRPLVASRVGGIPELVTDERFGILVPPGDATALAAALESALARHWDVTTLCARAQEFAWPAVIERLEDVYAELCGAPAQPTPTTQAAPSTPTPAR
ncbi:MAG: glycosyltransferase, partial [Candidatus Eiseniibacteriota bacterium]